MRDIGGWLPTLEGIRHTGLVATVAGQRRRVSPWVVVAGIVAVVALAWAVTSIAVGSGVSSGSNSVGIRPLFPLRLYRATPTPAEIQGAFATEGLSLAPAGSDLDAARLGPLRSHVVAAFELPGRSGMLVVLFDRPEPRSPMKVEDMAGGRDNGEGAGRVYVEYRSTALSASTAAAVRRAFRRLQ
jgi:hypothetical protein